MFSNDQTHDFARQALLRRWHTLENRWQNSHASSSGIAGNHSTATVETCPALWILPELLDLLSNHPDRPIEELASQIRRMLVDREFVDDNGDTCVSTAHTESIELQVRLIVEVLQDVRRNARQHGQWCGCPSCPQMFG
jgi:hypothetical protein